MQNFLLAFSALFSIVNPIAAALIFHQVAARRTRAERNDLARRIALYSALVMLGALWGGAHVLNFFGIDLFALRIGGGFVVSYQAWLLLYRPEQNEERKQEQAAPAEAEQDVAFFPLTIPFTTGPGTIAVAIALASGMPPGEPGTVRFLLAASAAAIVVAGVVWLAYAGAERLIALLGAGGARVTTRLAAFLLFCIGIQIALNGIADFTRTL